MGDISILKVLPIPALQDNYIWAIIHEKNKSCAMIDPGEAKPALDFLNTHGISLSAILITHHHWDHTDGIPDIIAQHPCPIFASSVKKIPHCQHEASEAQPIFLPELELTLKVISTPGHTKDHVCYYGNGCLFTGDTLFTGGCGRLFEGTAQAMYNSLQKLYALPNETLIYCGHEYTQKNLEFALTLEPQNQILRERMLLTDQLRRNHMPTVPSTLEMEKQTNPFLRCHGRDLIKAIEIYCGISETGLSAEKIFTLIRQLKDQYR